MTSSLVKLPAEAAHLTPVELPMPPVMYGIIAFALLMIGLLAVYAFRSVWTRH